jgi:hypothetical protein
MCATRGMTLSVEVCDWRSNYCTLGGTIERYDTREGFKKLCKFHGQAWPKVGESPEEAEKRTKRAKQILGPKKSPAERGKKRGRPFSGSIG